MSTTTRTLSTLLHLVLLTAAVASAALLVRFLSVETSLDAEGVRQALLGWGWWAPLGFIALYAAGANLMVPVSVLGTAAGFAFGWEHALLYGLAASTASQALGYWLSASVAREPVRRLLQLLRREGALLRIEEGHPFYTSFTARFVPVPQGVQNYLLGLARLPWGPYLAGSAAGTLPWLLAYVRLGDALEDPLSEGFWMAVGIYVVLVFTAGLVRRRRPAEPS